uniref:Doublecortin domain-containing protein n=1 Tax=Romanomermis culicivorax TaxID=13658 RepID=A0A915JL48_ROMCU
MTPTTDFGETSTLPRTSAKKRTKQSVCFLPILVQEKARQSFQGSSCVNVADVAATSNASSDCVQQQQPQRSFIRTCNRAKRVKFFRNGDQYFKGIWYAIAYDRYRCLEALLEDLNRTIGDLVNLPHGVRCIFTIDGSRRVKHLDDLLDGESYVCSSNDSFKKIAYDKAREPIWCYGTR